MIRFLALLLLIGGFLLSSQWACEMIRGEAAVQGRRFSPPTIITRSTKAEEFRLTMALHGAISILTAMAGWFLLSTIRREEALDLFSPDYKGTDMLDDLDETSRLDDAAQKLPGLSSSAIPVQLPVGRLVSILVCLVYLAVAFFSRPFIFSSLGTIYALLAFCLLLIWYPDEIGARTGYLMGHAGLVDSPTPGILISCASWFFLIGLPFLIWFLNR